MQRQTTGTKIYFIHETYAKVILAIYAPFCGQSYAQTQNMRISTDKLIWKTSQNWP